MHRSIPQLLELVIKLEERERCARHLEGGDVAADEVPHRVEPALAEQTLHLAVQQVQLELYLLYGEVERGLRERGLTPVRNLVGSYITSLEMAGASLTLLELDDELKELWDAPVHTAALRWGE